MRSVLAAGHVEQNLRDALDRLIQGRSRQSSHGPLITRITPAAVAREARCSRNTIYSTHRSILEAIRASNVSSTPAAELTAGLQRTIRDLRTEVRELRRDKQRLASENLVLLQRALADRR